MRKNISIQEFLLDSYTGKLNNSSVDEYLEIAKEQQKVTTQKNLFEQAKLWVELKNLCETIKQKSLQHGLHRQHSFSS